MLVSDKYDHEGSCSKFYVNLNFGNFWLLGHLWDGLPVVSMIRSRFHTKLHSELV